MVITLSDDDTSKCYKNDDDNSKNENDDNSKDHENINCDIKSCNGNYICPDDDTSNAMRLMEDPKTRMMEDPKTRMMEDPKRRMW